MHDAARDNHQLTVDKAIANLQATELGLRTYAAWWLGRFRVDTPAALEGLILSLGDEDDRTTAGGYPLRRNAARALGKLGNRQAVPALQEALACTDFYVREAAAQSLEMLGDPACVSTLIALLNNQIPGTLPAPEPPQLIQPFDAIIEALGTLGATEAIALIHGFLEHDVPRIRFAAARAMYQLSPDPQQANQYAERLVDALSHENLQIRRSALPDLGAIGYLPAAEAIAQTPVANSLRLFALQGLLEQQLKTTPLPNLSPGAIRVMTLMDQLL